MDFPDTLAYTPTHEWVRLEGDVATIGITAFAISQLTDLVDIAFVVQPAATLKAGQGFGEIESVKAASDLYAPLAGEVLEVNTAVSDDLDLLADDPYGNGWLLRMRLAQPEDARSLLSAAAYAEQVAREAH